METLPIRKSVTDLAVVPGVDVSNAPSALGLVHLVDPSLFTPPYDGALATALLDAGVAVELVGRPLRPADDPIAVPYRPFFYRLFDGAPRPLGHFGALLKAAEHVGDGLAFALSTSGLRHFQWLPFPLADATLLRLARRRGPVVVTVHDTAPFNGTPTHRLQGVGFAAALRVADRLIVHTASGRDRLVALGLDPARIAVIPHGPLGASRPAPRQPRAGRFTLVAFGKIRPYKGLDLLLDALGAVDPEVRQGLRVIIAGEPMIDIGPLAGRIRDGGLAGTVDLLPRRLDEAEMDALFDTADGFVFPYREIEASGVFYLTQGLGRWVIATRLGAFAEALQDGVSGRLVAPGDVQALAAALAEAATGRPRPSAPPLVSDWATIARDTVRVYEAAWGGWHAARTSRPAVAVAR